MSFPHGYPSYGIRGYVLSVTPFHKHRNSVLPHCGRSCSDAGAVACSENAAHILAHSSMVAVRDAHCGDRRGVFWVAFCDKLHIRRAASGTFACSRKRTASCRRRMLQ